MTDFALPELDTVTLADKGIDVPLTKLDGTPLLNAKKEPVVLVLHGFDSKVYRDASRRIARARADRVKTAEPGSDEALDALDTDLIELLVSCTVDWRGLLDTEGKDVKPTKDNMRAFYRRFPPAREQADRAIMDRTRFTKASSGA